MFQNYIDQIIAIFFTVNIKIIDPDLTKAKNNYPDLTKAEDVHNHTTD